MNRTTQPRAAKWRTLGRTGLAATFALTRIAGSAAFANTPQSTERPSTLAAPEPADCQLGPIPKTTAWTEIGSSVKGRPIAAKRLGAGPTVVVWIGGIHGNEREGARTTERLDTLVDGTELSKRITLFVIDDANPDGTTATTRGNANAVDLNRNFPAGTFAAAAAHGKTPLSEPESCAVASFLQRTDPVLTLVAHSHSKVSGINYDGPARADAQRFALATDFAVVENTELSATGHPGSLGQWWGHDLQRRILTVEWERGENPETAWTRSRPGILAVLAGAAGIASPDQRDVNLPPTDPARAADPAAGEPPSSDVLTIDPGDTPETPGPNDTGGVADDDSQQPPGSDAQPVSETESDASGVPSDPAEVDTSVGDASRETATLQQSNNNPIGRLAVSGGIGVFAAAITALFTRNRTRTLKDNHGA